VPPEPINRWGEVAHHAEERQLRLLFAGDHLHIESRFGLHTVDKLFPVNCFADRAGGNRADLTYLKSTGDLLHSPQGGNRGIDHRRVEAAGAAQPHTQSRGLLLFVENTVIAVAQRFGHDQTDAVGADVDGGQAMRQFG
jgi:hypothetical protein